MFYSTKQAEDVCSCEPALLFDLIKESDKEVLENILNSDTDFNIEDDNGNNIIMCLLKNKYYDLVLKYIDRVDINHQNAAGDTIMHILFSIDYKDVREIIEYILENMTIDLNIKNNLGETILDKSISKNYLYTTIKILENDSFDSIDIYSFKKLYETYIKSNNYGMYSKLSNLEIIMDSIEHKRLIPKMRKLVYLINNNKDDIEKDFYKSKIDVLDNLINKVVKEVIN
ncbi:MAG: hypothetical protein IJ068_01345 [Bacilli bacterium]|nr:hypothetical protein [Bacilli bacterium]